MADKSEIGSCIDAAAVSGQCIIPPSDRFEVARIGATNADDKLGRNDGSGDDDVPSERPVRSKAGKAISASSMEMTLHPATIVNWAAILHPAATRAHSGSSTPTAPSDFPSRVRLAVTARSVRLPRPTTMMTNSAETAAMAAMASPSEQPYLVKLPQTAPL